MSILETNEDFKSLNTIDGFEESFKNSNQGTSTAASEKATRVSEVLGADIKSIMTMLSKDFILLMGISFVISTPLLIYGLNLFL